MNTQMKKTMTVGGKEYLFTLTLFAKIERGMNGKRWHNLVVTGPDYSNERLIDASNVGEEIENAEKAVRELGQTHPQEVAAIQGLNALGFEISAIV